jgi:hypothetical protein
MTDGPLDRRIRLPPNEETPFRGPTVPHIDTLQYLLRPDDVAAIVDELVLVKVIDIVVDEIQGERPSGLL